MPAGSEISISILVAAHNEEKKIGGFLAGLEKAVADGVEVLVGLDGCTDGTAAIARQFAFVRLLEFSQRRGKSALLTDMLNAARGDIVIVCDVDWDVLVKDGWQRQLAAVFADGTVGGVVLPTANLPFVDRWYLDRMSLAFRGEAWGSYFLGRYQAETQTKADGNGRSVDTAKMDFPFTVNICRRKAIGDFHTTGDDFERCLQLLKAGYRLPLDESGIFLFRATDIDKTMGDMLRQRTRGGTVYQQLYRHYGYAVKLRSFMLRQTLYTLPRLLALRPKDVVAVMLWYAVAALGFLKGLRQRAADRSTEELWKLRAER